MKNTLFLLALLFIGTATGFAQKGPGAKQRSPAEIAGTTTQLYFFAGGTDVNLSDEFGAALASLNIDVAPASLGPIRRGIVRFPITSGTIDIADLRGEILHSSGLTLFRTTSSVRIEGFAINTAGAQPFINGLASANGAVVDRIPLFNLNLSNATVTASGNFVNITNVGVTLRAEAAAALNAVFETTAFVEGFNVGTAEVGGYTNNIPAP